MAVLAALLLAAGCTPANEIVPRLTDHFRLAGLRCDDGGRGTEPNGLVRLRCGGTINGLELVVRTEADRRGLLRVVAELPPGTPHNAARAIWTRVIAPMPGLEGTGDLVTYFLGELSAGRLGEPGLGSWGAANAEDSQGSVTIEQADAWLRLTVEPDPNREGLPGGG